MSEKAYQQTIRSLKAKEQDLLKQLAAVRTAIAAISALLPNRATAEMATGRILAGGKPGSVSDAVYLALRQENRPMHVMEIVERIQAGGFATAQDPRALRQTIAGMLSRKKKGGDDTFVMLGDGKVSLSEFELAEPALLEIVAPASDNQFDDFPGPLDDEIDAATV